MANIRELANVPEISFIEGLTLEETEALVLEQYRRTYKALTGKDAELGEADSRRLLIKAFALVEYQTMQYIEAKGRMELLKTSTGDALDNLSALFGIYRKGAEKAKSTQRFILSEPRQEIVAIPAGTRVKTKSGKYFNTMDYAEVTPGTDHVDVMIQAEEAGAGSSGIMAGDIDTLVDPIPYVASVENITESAGGLDTEDDTSLTERTYLAPSKYSCAGPKDAYEYFVREWRTDLEDVQITSPSPCVVEIYVVMAGGRLPNETEREDLERYINGESIRPLCDQVICTAPEEVPYTITATYWIGESDQKSAGMIQEKVSAAVSGFEAWQRKLGRDINPSELIARIRGAGAKRVTLTAPRDIVVPKTGLPKCTETILTYGGLEDD